MEPLCALSVLAPRVMSVYNKTKRKWTSGPETQLRVLVQTRVCADAIPASVPCRCLTSDSCLVLWPPRWGPVGPKPDGGDFTRTATPTGRGAHWAHGGGHAVQLSESAEDMATHISRCLL
ncbi:hypothetical protein Q5P01_010436 [Channa striata]|uniref:Uncharacterized protein n=1 Tax=Channa striata TaxID=64152 RepID=A0AA88SYC9_CHASR|nr:hypothetical protein Q5P01_010436 [Channa striata]